jgi:hypothetical protein
MNALRENSGCESAARAGERSRGGHPEVTDVIY